MAITNSIVLADNAYGTIGSGLAVGDTAMTFTTGHGTRFPAVVAGQVLYCCLLNSTNVLEEIKVTAHAAGSDSATIVRAANSTTAKAWSAGDRIEARISSEVLRRLQEEALTETAITTADSGATYTGTMAPAMLGYITGLIYPLTLTTSNNGTAPTIALNGLSAITVKLDGGGALAGNQLPVNGLYKFDGTNFIVLNPLTPGWSTGDVKLSFKTAADIGWVLMNDLTIGNAASSATGRANADTSALFTVLWTNTVNADCAVSTGRGVSAAADYAANKTIALPKALGRALATYGAGSGLTSRALASVVGEEAHALTGPENGPHTHDYLAPTGALGNFSLNAGANPVNSFSNSNTTTSSGSGTAHNTMQPTVFLNVMIKL